MTTNVTTASDPLLFCEANNKVYVFIRDQKMTEEQIESLFVKVKHFDEHLNQENKIYNVVLETKDRQIAIKKNGQKDMTVELVFQFLIQHYLSKK